MPEFIRKRERIEVPHVEHVFEWPDAPGAGFSFDVDPDTLEPIFELPQQRLGKMNYEMCLEKMKTGEIIDKGIIRYSHSYTKYAVIKCTCGAEVELSNYDTECVNCYRMYNTFGQELDRHAYHCPICREGGDCGG